MNDRQLQNFVLIAQEGSLSRAAERAFLSVPSLKKQMDALEAEVKAKLFERNNRGVCLTKQGQIFLEFAQNTLSQWQKVKKQLSPQENRILIGYNSNHIRDFIYYRALKQFKMQYPEIRVLLEAAQTFDSSVFDLFLGRCDTADEQIGKARLGRMPLHGIVDRAGALAKKKILQPQDLKNIELLIPPEYIQKGIEPNIMETLHAAGCEKLRVNSEDGSAYTINSYVSNGVSIIVGRERELPEDVCQIPLKGFTYDYEIYYTKASIKRPIVRTYIHILQMQYEQIINEI